MLTARYRVSKPWRYYCSYTPKIRGNGLDCNENSTGTALSAQFELDVRGQKFSQVAHCINMAHISLFKVKGNVALFHDAFYELYLVKNIIDSVQFYDVIIWSNW